MFTIEGIFFVKKEGSSFYQLKIAIIAFADNVTLTIKISITCLITSRTHTRTQLPPSAPLLPPPIPHFLVHLLCFPKKKKKKKMHPINSHSPGHDGTVRFIDGWWWMHSAEYGICADPPNQGCQQIQGRCGFHNDHNVSIYRSRTMASGTWERVGTAVECAQLPDCGILYRPHMVQHPRTKKYLLYYNYVNKRGQYAGDAVAQADSPAGPFTLVKDLVNTTFNTGDFDVLVDEVDGKAYIIYSAHYFMFIEELTPDMTASTGKFATFTNTSKSYQGKPAFPEYFVEAPSMFKRGDTYYALFGHCCCFCWQGSGMYVFTAPHPMGPWTQQGASDNDLGCGAEGTHNPTPAQAHTLPLTAEVTPGQGCNYGGAVAASTSRAQQNFVVQVPAADGTMQYVWTGDRWMQAPDGVKGHEPQYWTVLEFDAQGRILPLRWQDNVTISLKQEAWQ